MTKNPGVPGRMNDQMSAANGYGTGIRPTNRSMTVGFSIGLGAKSDEALDRYFLS